jgi:hypothetical protein
MFHTLRLSYVHSRCIPYRFTYTHAVYRTALHTLTLYTVPLYVHSPCIPYRFTYTHPVYRTALRHSYTMIHFHDSLSTWQADRDIWGGGGGLNWDWCQKREKELDELAPDFNPSDGSLRQELDLQLCYHSHLTSNKHVQVKWHTKDMWSKIKSLHF